MEVCRVNELIWDGEMDCGWEDLASKVKSESQRFTDEMLKTVAFSPSEEAKKINFARKHGKILPIS